MERKGLSWLGHNSLHLIFSNHASIVSYPPITFNYNPSTMCALKWQHATSNPPGLPFLAPALRFSGCLFIVPFMGIKVRQLQTILRQGSQVEIEGINNKLLEARSCLEVVKPSGLRIKRGTNITTISYGLWLIMYFKIFTNTWACESWSNKRFIDLIKRQKLPAAVHTALKWFLLPLLLSQIQQHLLLKVVFSVVDGNGIIVTFAQSLKFSGGFLFWLPWDVSELCNMTSKFNQNIQYSDNETQWNSNIYNLQCTFLYCAVFLSICICARSFATPSPIRGIPPLYVGQQDARIFIENLVYLNHHTSW